jgi:hypothetical protein
MPLLSPYTAIKSDIYKKIDSPVDTDGDGVSDTKDDYPNDPNKAFDNIYPSNDAFGTLAFEDLWPAKGDYDFNDLVVDYNINQVTNAQNMIVEIECTFQIACSWSILSQCFCTRVEYSCLKQY